MRLGIRRSRLYCMGYLLFVMGLGMFISKFYIPNGRDLIAGFRSAVQAEFQSVGERPEETEIYFATTVGDTIDAAQVGADELASALGRWTMGGIPDEVMWLAAVCTPRDAADAVIRGAGGVVDVGANKGYPVTQISLQRSVTWVLSIEPDDRNYKSLSNLQPRDKQTQFIAVRGAASSTVGQMSMKFHRKRDDFSCFHCLNASKEEVFSMDVDTWTVDSLILEENVSKAKTQLTTTRFHDDTSSIILFKTDTQGHELEVLTGATQLLASGRVQNLLVEFDPKLLRTREQAIETIRLIFDAGLQCAHLKFAGTVPNSTVEEAVPPRFGRAVVPETLERFVDFVTSTGRYTDLFCSHRQ